MPCLQGPCIWHSATLLLQNPNPNLNPNLNSNLNPNLNPEPCIWHSETLLQNIRFTSYHIQAGW